MKFLTKLGQILLKATTIITGIAPFIPSNQVGLYTTISKDLSEIANIVVQAEVFGQSLNLPGAQKLQAASPAVAQIILQSAILANHKIANEDLFKQGVTKITDGMADVLNSLHDNVETTEKV